MFEIQNNFFLLLPTPCLPASGTSSIYRNRVIFYQFEKLFQVLLSNLKVDVQ